MTSRDIIQQTKQLVAIPSTADNPVALRQAVDFVADLLKAYPGITVERFESGGKSSFLAYYGTDRPEKFDILLNGHVDVVPGNPEQFTAYERDGKLFGRGVLDMKGTALVLTDVFCEMADKVPYKLGLQIVSDEETGGYDGVQYQIKQGIDAHFVIMGEYANDRHAIYNAARGLCWAEIAFKGKTAHGGHLWKGTNAVVKASEFATSVLERYPTPKEETWTTTASIASMSTSNDTYNKVPDQAVLKIDFRFTKDDSVFYSKESIKEFIASIDPEAELINVAVFEPAVGVDELNPYVQGLGVALTEVTGEKPRHLGRPAGSDGRHYGLIGTDIVEFGLYGEHSHGDDEYVELASFEEYQAILRRFLLNPTSNKLEKQSVSEPLHRKLLKDLVAIPTVTSDRAANNRALQYIETFLSARGMYVSQFESNGYKSIVATVTPGDKTPKVLLTGHIDVVPAKPEQFTLTTNGDELRGRGTLDMKWAIASYLWLVDELQGNLREYDFGIMITSDEEIGSANGMKPLIEQEGYRSQVVVAPDSGENWQFEHFAKGVQWVELEASGTPAHASRPWEGESAIRRLLEALQEIKKLSPADPQPEDTFISVGTLSGGTVANQIPEVASAMLDIRYGAMDDFKTLLSRIEEICRSHGVRTTVHTNEPPVSNDMNNPLIKPFWDAVEGVIGRSPGVSYSYAATDGRFFSTYDIPCVIVSPPGSGRHKETEWLSAEGYDQFCEVLSRYMNEVALKASPYQ